jgi:hypothetical protein
MAQSRGRFSVLDSSTSTSTLLTPSPQNDTTRLNSQWIHFIDVGSEGSDTPWVLGDWIELISPRVGASMALDKCLEAFLLATTLYLDSSDKNLHAVNVANIKAFEAIRKTIASAGGDVEGQESILLAILLMYHVEVSRLWISRLIET